MLYSHPQEAQEPLSYTHYATREYQWHGATRSSGCPSMSTPSPCISQPRTTCLLASMSSLGYSVPITSAHLSLRQYILLGLMLFISNINANEFDPMHPQFLTADKTQFQIGSSNFYAKNMPDAKLIYSTTLEDFCRVENSRLLRAQCSQ